MKRLSLLIAGMPMLASALLGCTKKETPPPPPAPVVDAAPATIAAPDARDIAKNACLSCHEMDMLEQQRLTEAQWTKVVAKMQGWGANLTPTDAPALVAWLSANFGPDAGAWTIAEGDATELLRPVTPSDDANYANGNAEKGKPLYADRCSGCHAPNGEGHVGVNLVARPSLYRADDFAWTLRRGKGKMPPSKIEDSEVADLLAYLRTLR